MEVSVVVADRTVAARFLVDTGGGGTIVTQPVAEALGLGWGDVRPEGSRRLAPVKQPVGLSVGDFGLPVDPERVLVMLDADNILPASTAARAEGLLPGHVLARCHVVFDYPAGTFTIGGPGCVRPVGHDLVMPVSQRQRFPRTELTIDGVTYGFLLDTGAAFTMVSDALVEDWVAVHPEWPCYEGAMGEAALLGGQTLRTMILPLARWGPYQLEHVGVVSQQPGTFERWMSSMMSAPVVGALAGNVLKEFRIELDYASDRLFFARERKL